MALVQSILNNYFNKIMRDCIQYGPLFFTGGSLSFTTATGYLIPVVVEFSMNVAGKSSYTPVD